MTDPILPLHPHLCAVQGLDGPKPRILYGWDEFDVRDRWREWVVLDAKRITEREAEEWRT